MLEATDIEGFLDVILPEIAAASEDELMMMCSVPEAWSMLVRGAKRYAAQSDAYATRVDDLVAQG